MTSNKILNFSKKEAIDYGFKKAKENILFFIGLFIIWFIIMLSTSFIQEILKSNNQQIIYFLFSLITWVIGSVISMGKTNVLIKLVNDKKVDFKDLYYVTKLFNFMLADLIRNFLILLGLLLFIVPGIILAIKFQFAEYLIVDKKMDAIDALKASWEITKGVKMNLFLLGLILGLVNIIGFLCLIVGLLFTVPLSMLATTYVYKKLLSQSPFK